jgi:hypothetical protein
VNSSSKGQKYFICREEKGKSDWGHAAGPRNWWSHGSGWKLGFIAFFVLPKGGDVSQVKTEISCEGKVSPWPIVTSPSFKSPLSMIALTAVKERDD